MAEYDWNLNVATFRELRWRQSLNMNRDIKQTSTSVDSYTVFMSICILITPLETLLMLPEARETLSFITTHHTGFHLQS